MANQQKFVAVIVLGLLGLLLLTAYAPPRAAADATPTPTPMDMSEHDHGARLEAQGASVKIVSPQAGAVLEHNAVIVRVETTHWPLGEGKHFHLYVNGQEQGMSQGSNPSLQARDLQPGENTLEVVLSNDLHQELNATDKIVVRVEAADMSTQETSAPAAAPAIPPGALVTLLLVGVTIAAILGIGFAITRKRSG